MESSFSDCDGHIVYDVSVLDVLHGMIEHDVDVGLWRVQGRAGAGRGTGQAAGIEEVEVK